MTTTKPKLIERFFTTPGVDPYNTVQWSKRDTKIVDASGKIYFEQNGVEFPTSWSDDAVRITTSKYFKGTMGTGQRETSLRDVIKRVVNKIREAGQSQGLIEHGNESVVFGDELSFLLINQLAAFNSPVWFNCGVVDERSAGWCWDAQADSEENDSNITGNVRRVLPKEHRPQCSACFIVSVHDSMESILDWTKTEGLIFKFGSGSGANLSELRSSREFLSSGGKPSGPLEFMKINDQAAGSIKSGGKHRRAAKMVILNSDHPDIFEFVGCKADEERKIKALVSAGWNDDFADPNGAQASAFFQNANHSVSVNDEFMRAVFDDTDYSTRKVTDPTKIIDTFRARKLFRSIAEAAWKCGDPGLQFRDTMNTWNMVSGSAPIRATNPCSEFVFPDDNSCNLASLNLMKFRMANGGFNTTAFGHAVALMILAQEILVDLGSYPTRDIAVNTHNFRPLGLGYCNLGAFLMANGFPYDSKRGRDTATKITALMTGYAYYQSSRIAERIEPFKAWSVNKAHGRHVIEQHYNAAKDLQDPEVTRIWDSVWDSIRVHGLRNAQVTVLAPTGTIGFMMDCDTTGIEPELSLVKYKNLVGGGQMKIVNQTVKTALNSLGYSQIQIDKCVEEIEIKGHVESCVDPSYLAVFDTAFPAGPSNRSIPFMGHIAMMAAVQPFLSGAISKTVNLPESATIGDIEQAYIAAWKLGLKAIAVYRNNCKSSQPFETKADVQSKTYVKTDITNVKVATVENVKDVYSEGLTVGMKLGKQAGHRKLIGDRMAIVHEFKIAGHKGFLTVGMYEDGMPGEIFLDMSKEGSTISGLLDTIAILTSLGLQHGVPLQKLVDKFSHTKFDPAGITDDPDIRFADSVPDYLFRYLEHKFLTPKEGVNFQVQTEAAAEENLKEEKMEAPALSAVSDDAPLCVECGNSMVRNGSCYRCPNCGGTSGCS